MTREELASLPKGTKLFLISRKVSRSGMRQVFDVFYLEMQSLCADLETAPTSITLNCREMQGLRPLWIRLHGTEQRDFNKRFGVHACGSVDEDGRVGGSFYVNGCGFSRSDELVQSLGTWASDDPKHFICEVL